MRLGLSVQTEQHKRTQRPHLQTNQMNRTKVLPIPAVYFQARLAEPGGVVDRTNTLNYTTAQRWWQTHKQINTRAPEFRHQAAVQSTPSFHIQPCLSSKITSGHGRFDQTQHSNGVFLAFIQPLSKRLASCPCYL